MSDNLTIEQRRFTMSRIKSKDSLPEKLVRSFLFSQGFRFNIHVKDISGTPDIVIKKLKTVFFINGCFWHGHKNCRFAKVPKSNVDYWEKKIKQNQQRDINIISQLNMIGWRVITIWECELSTDKRTITLQRILDNLNNSVSS